MGGRKDRRKWKVSEKEKARGGDLHWKDVEEKGRIRRDCWRKNGRPEQGPWNAMQRPRRPQDGTDRDHCFAINDGACY